MVHVSDWGLMMKYLNDWIWLRLSNRYNVTHATHALGDVYNRWVNEVTGSLGVDLVDFYLDRIPDAASLNDAEYAYWAGGPLSDAVLWLDAGSTHPSLVKVPNLGSGGNVLDAQYGDGSTVGTFPTLLEHTGENYVYLPGVAGNYASTPDAAALDITGDIEIVLRVNMDDWTPGAEQYLLAKYTTTGDQRSYAVSVTTAGRIALRNSVDGINAIYRQSDVPSPGFNGTIWLKITLDVNTGSSTNNTVFYYAADQATEPVSWTQLTATTTTTPASTTTSIYSGSAVLEVGSINVGVSGTLAGKVYRAIVRNGIGGTTVFDADFTKLAHGGQTTFVESSANAATVTINRSATGRKTVLVDRNVWLFGTDDYLEIPDNDLLDFGADDKFTLMIVARKWGTSTGQQLLAKTDSQASSMLGYGIQIDTTTSTVYRLPLLGDGTTRRFDASESVTAGDMYVIVGVRDKAGSGLSGYVNNFTNAATSDTSTGTLANSEVFRVGRLSGSGTSYFDGEVVAVAVWRRALTADEIALVTQYYNLSIGPWGGLVLGEDDLPILTESGDVINVE